MNLGEFRQQLRAADGADGVQVRLELSFVRGERVVSRSNRS